MNVRVESIFDCGPEHVWDEVQKSALLLEVMRPLVGIAPVDGTTFPERWCEGTPVRCKLYLLGQLPVGTRTIEFARIDPWSQMIQTREQDWLIRRWDHLIRVRPTDDGRTRYSDEIEIDAGPWTIFVWLFAYCFYCHRQRRWRRVAMRLKASQSLNAPG